MPKLPVVSARELVRALGRLGFSETHRVGSHAQFKDGRGRRVTVSVHVGKVIKKKTLKGIVNDLEMTVEGFIAVLRS